MKLKMKHCFLQHNGESPNTACGDCGYIAKSMDLANARYRLRIQVRHIIGHFSVPVATGMVVETRCLNTTGQRTPLIAGARALTYQYTK